MMPLTMVNTGEPSVIKKVGGKEETRRFLEKLGFVPGGTVTVVSEIEGNICSVPRPALNPNSRHFRPFRCVYSSL